MAKHPELRDGEMFIGNFSQLSRHLAHVERLGYVWRTKRTGNAAYDDKGNVIAHLKPVFISLEEARSTGRKIDLQNMAWDRSDDQKVRDQMTANLFPQRLRLIRSEDL